MKSPIRDALLEHLILRGVDQSCAVEALESLPTLIDILIERARQVKKFGVQHHASGTGPDVVTPEYMNVETMAQAEDMARGVVESGGRTWMNIALEEVFEAGASEGPALMTELVQTAAVFVAWHSDLRSNDASGR